MHHVNIRQEFSSSFVLMLVKVGDRKVHLTFQECNYFIDWWQNNRDYYEDWVESDLPQNKVTQKIWRLGLSWPEYNSLYNDCIRMKAANLKYKRRWITSDRNRKVVNLYK